MADALLSALASTILTNLNSLVLGEFAIAGGLKTELNNLESPFTTIQAVLHDAEEKQWKSEAMKNWLHKLKDAAYEADDVLNEYAIQAQRRRLPKDLTFCCF
ncbi:putative disease resistance protein RGA3 [Ricinus communis]|uniref:putative disease resistance protein RGA3 n=1 Tax=Ricinus communis TaxID=3988 RepID=UPI00201AC7B9|nr:putative disease resistance protein RGA3 [Ricinus communis]